jgi:hypothetical protein
MSTIPNSYLEVINPLIHTAKSFLENGETLVGMAFVGNFESGMFTPVILDSGSNDAKDNSAMAIKTVAALHQADYVFMLMEAWSLRGDKIHLADEIYAKYGSIAASPYAIDVVSMILETRHGVWIAQQPIVPKGISKKKRTIANPQFTFCDGMKGRFADLLPIKEDEKTVGSLH